MKAASLLYLENRKQSPCMVGNARELTDDLQLDVLFQAMANDTLIADAARKIMLDAENPTPETVLYRQAVLQDAIQQTAVCQSLYDGLCETLEKYEKYRQESKPSFARFSPTTTRVRDAAVMSEILLGGADKTAQQLTDHLRLFASEGFNRVAEAFISFYDKSFISAAKHYLRELTALGETSAIQYGVRPGPGFKYNHFTVISIQAKEPDKLKAVPGKQAVVPLNSIALQAQAAGLFDAGMIKLLRILGEINEHTLSDLRRLRVELGFYVGGARLYHRFRAIGQSVVFPRPAGETEQALAFTGLADAALAVVNSRPPVPNAVSMSGISLTLVTGANQGGKSTFLRSVGQALLMSRCGLFVAAEYFTAGMNGGLFTHFCREEDHRNAPDSGRLDEELARISGIIDRLTPDSILLMNESFSSTSEREGAWMAGEILPALRARGVRIIFVTHVTEYAIAVYENDPPCDILFLKAGRSGDGARSYLIAPGAPEPTGYGLDLYRELIGEVSPP